MKRFLLALTTFALVAGSAVAQMTPEEKEAFKFADKLVKKMTLREKFGQLEQFITRKGEVTGPGGVKCDIESAIRKGEVGSFLSIRKREEAMRLQKMAVEESRLGIPLIFGYDIIHGCRTIFPENLGMSCSWDIEAVEQYARIAAEETAAFGTIGPSRLCAISRQTLVGVVSRRVQARIHTLVQRLLPLWCVVIRVIIFRRIRPLPLASSTLQLTAQDRQVRITIRWICRS